MTIAFVSNDSLTPAINWSTLGPPMREAFSQNSAEVIEPRGGRRGMRYTPRQWAAAHRASAVFWMQLSARPENEVLTVALAARRRSAWVADAWPYSVPKIATAARLLRLDPCFVAFREGVDLLRRDHPQVRVEHLPFGVDTRVFRPQHGITKDIFAFWMGRRHEPLHRALIEYCDGRQLKYVTSQNGEISDPYQLGDIVARSRYFVVTTPDVDHPERAGGFSPLVMRYLEGLASGTRLLGTRPRSGELEAAGLADGLLEVRADGTDLAQRLADDAGTADVDGITGHLAEVVRDQHSWQARAKQVLKTLETR